MPAKKATKKRSMSDVHKQALADGRAQGRAVRDYLAALGSANRSPGRKPTTTPEEVQRQIDAESDPARRVELIQRRLDLEARLAAAAQQSDVDRLEKEFVKAVKPYAERKGISYSAFRELGVPAAVLKAAGIPRTRRGG